MYSGEDAFSVIADTEKIYVASGKKILEFVTGKADKEELLKSITGRTGNLRAPALKIGKICYVGFSAEMYDSLE